MKNRAELLATILLVSFQLFNCAKMEAPPGGPPDITPPSIIATVPSQGDLNVSLKTEIRITFSEKIYKDNIIKNVFIVPQLDQAPKISWQKNELLIKTIDDLKENQTYLITLKTGFQDLRKNKLTKPFRLAFSTGQYLDAGVIEGMVYSKLKPIGDIDIWAFAVDSGFSIYDRSPAYITQTSDSGDYRFEYLADGEYYCFAVDDRDADREYDPLKDMIGLPVSSLVLDSNLRYYGNIDFHLFKEDTVSLKIISVDFTRDLMIAVKVSSGIYAPDLTVGNFMVQSVIDNRAVALKDLIYLRDSTGRVFLLPDEVPTRGVYQLRIIDFNDLAGNPISPGSDTLSFSVEIDTDTTPPALMSSYPSDGEKSFAPTDSAKFVFNELIQFDSSDTTALYFMREDSIYYYDINLNVDKNRIVAVSVDSLIGGKTYTAFFDLSKITDIYGNRMAHDSSLRIKFAVGSSDDFGSISGRMVLPTGFDIGKIIVSVSSLDQKLNRRVAFDDSLYFKLNLPAGKYFFHAFEDRNGDGVYNPGKVFPLEYAEKEFLFDGEYSIRSRFETEDVLLEIK